jgi:uncharacterized protein (TIGR03382 family)
MLRLVVLGSLLAGLAGTALANGRNPATSTINFRRGMESHVINGMTFGVVISKDNGATWTWQCEDAVGYGGMYDPDYAITNSGALFATTFDGLKVNRDGCVYTGSVLSPEGSDPIRFFSAVTVASDGAIYASSVDMTDGKIYKSTDDGATFPQAVLPPGTLPNDWWQSLETAPSDPDTVYLSGYRAAGQGRVFFLFKSTDGGQTFAPMPQTGISTTPNSTIEFVGIGRTDPDLIYARVTLSQDLIGDAIYRSTNGGTSWTKILELDAAISFVLRGNGQLVAGTQVMGSFSSDDQGLNWTPLVNPPKINCLAENSAGEVWACTQNYGTPQEPGDGFGIMKTTDLATWTGVLKYQDLREPEPCPVGTVQRDKCDAQLWCGLCAQLGCNANRNCEVNGDGVPVDGPVVNDPKGCCQSGGDGVAGLLAISGAVGMVLLRRRRRS